LAGEIFNLSFSVSASFWFKSLTVSGDFNFPVSGSKSLPVAIRTSDK
jgi:hypothetical protein